MQPNTITIRIKDLHEEFVQDFSDMLEERSFGTLFTFMDEMDYRYEHFLSEPEEFLYDKIALSFTHAYVDHLGRSGLSMTSKQTQVFFDILNGANDE